MYSPRLNKSLVRTIYRIKRFYRKPMTEIAEDLIKKSLCTVEKELVCMVCVGERNNECNCCCLNGKESV